MTICILQSVQLVYQLPFIGGCLTEQFGSLAFIETFLNKI